VIDKPAGLAVHPGAKRQKPRTLSPICVRLPAPPSPVHRLDRDTSGCLLLSRNPRRISASPPPSRPGAVEKSYLAIVAGVPDAEEGRIDLPLHKISSREEGWRMVHDAARGKPAVTNWRRLAIVEGRALLLMTPETGRTHQLRVHAAEGLGLPIAGDPVYGDGRGPMLLHARSLRFERGAKEPVEATAPLPPTFLQAGFGDDLL
jgi:tRNA pseudouridine32 synthase/23S rRNA pseudouridine746 synthase